MNIKEARWSGGELILATSDPGALRFALNFEPGDYKIVKESPRRSLTANNYAWVLIDKLSAALHIGKLEIYRNTIRDIGGVSDSYCMVEEAYPMFKQCWEKQGDGWQTEAQPSKLDGCVTVTAYRGSSSYDVAQMSALIDHLVQDCQALGIETMPPDKLAGLLEIWHGQ